MKPVSIEAYETALANKKVCTEKDIAMLVAQLSFPEGAATTKQISDTCGSSPDTVNLLYGRLGHRVADEIGLSVDKRANGERMWWSALSTGVPSGNGFIWTMRPEVAQALQNLGYLEPKWHMARLTFNTNGWTAPSGINGKSTTEGLHESEYGFGHEEWLFDFSKKIRGYQYGFIESFRTKNDKHAGKTYNLRLFTFNFTTKAKFWIGSIRNCYVLPYNEQEKIQQVFYKKGWMGDKAGQMKALGLFSEGAKGSLNELYPNVRFKHEDVVFFDPPTEVPDSIFFRNRERYLLYELEQKQSVSEYPNADGFDFAPSKPNNERSVFREHQQELQSKEVLQNHRKLSIALYKQLAHEFGSENIACDLNTGDGTFVDIVRKDGDAFVLYEIKTYNELRKNIREAIGQLLEYAYWKQECKIQELIIVTEQKPDDAALRYLEFLRKSFRVPMSHLSLSI